VSKINDEDKHLNDYNKYRDSLINTLKDKKDTLDFKWLEYRLGAVERCIQGIKNARE
jgi:hypothetical protein|tara:strand:+ start:4992 stop:5162 length:171 start_codon:yes stop_codon:yes gene_type:complete